MTSFRLRAGIACGVLVALLLLGGRSRGDSRADVYALVGGRVATVSGSVLENGTVVLRDGLIESVGSSVAAPPDARVIDVKGLTLTPGIIDGFGGIGLPEAKGGKPDANASSPLAPQEFVLAHLRVADALKARDTGITTALVVPREGVLPGRSVLINLSGDTPDAMVLLQPAFLHLHMATLRMKYPGSLMGTVAYARQALADAAHYRDAFAAYDKAPRGHVRPRYDAALAAWQDVLAGRQVLIVTAPRENDIRRALALADEFKVKVAIADARHAHAVADILKARRVPLLVSVNFDPPQPAGFGADEDEDKERRDIEDAERNPAALQRAGVPFALVSGHAPDFLAGVRKAVERGLPREAALRAVTLSAAEALGVADRLGSLEAGKIANVVAWSGDPLTEGAKAKMVFVDGELYEPDARPASPAPSPAPSPTPSPSLYPSPSPSPSPSPGVIR